MKLLDFLCYENSCSNLQKKQYYMVVNINENACDENVYLQLM